MDIHLRPAGPADKATLFSWRNDPWIIRHGSSRTAVTWEQHTGWFQKVTANDDYLLFIVETATSEGIGCVRVERQGASAEIHIYLLQAHTGRGLGPVAIDLGCTAAFERWPTLENIRALVRGDNARSRRAFLHAGFALGPNDTGDHGLMELLRARPQAVLSGGGLS